MIKRPVIITRAEPGASETADRLRALGYDDVLSPMLVLTSVAPAPALSAPGLQGLVFTSANGVRFFAEASTERALPAWCVGPATFAAAQSAGFAEARSADGDAAALGDFIVEHADVTAGPLLHVANTAAAGALVERLRHAGFDARFAGLYEPRPSKHLSEAATTILDGRSSCAILFHSAKGAAAFETAARDCDLSHAIAIGVSGKALDAVRALPFERTIAADHPNEDRLIEALIETFPPV